MKPYPPEDLGEFWAEAEAEARAQPLDCHRTFKKDYSLQGFKVERIEFRGMGGKTLSGWLAAPDGARRLPAFVWVPPYGRESLLPDEYGTRQGYASLSFNFFGHDAFHQEKYTRERGYFAEGADSPDTWIFREMYQNASIAARVLQAQVEVDAERVGAMGMSQGGGMSIWLGAWCPVIRAVCADMPFLGDVVNTLARPVHRYPLKELQDFVEATPLGHERVSNTLSYFDTMNVATRCAVPTCVSLGLRDPAAKPSQVRAIFEALPGEKDLIEFDWGHDWLPEMVGRNQAWFDRHLRVDTV